MLLRRMSASIRWNEYTERPGPPGDHHRYTQKLWGPLSGRFCWVLSTAHRGMPHEQEATKPETEAKRREVSRAIRPQPSTEDPVFDDATALEIPVDMSA
jgi:hypothetical protein